MAVDSPPAARSTATSKAVLETATPETTFYPPKQKPLMARLVQSISYPLGRVLYKVRLSVSDDSVARFRSVEHSRIVVVCNHPTMEDGITLFVLSARLGQLFHYIVAHESFKGLLGEFIQRLGCYSIRRGLGDRASISQTLSILKEPQCRLVIFPEGGCSYQNDTIMPFRPGAIQLPMSALAQLAKKAASPAQIPDFYVVPLSLKYRYQQPMQRVIEKTLARLEEQLTIPPSDLDDYQRLRQIGNQVILKIEAEAGLGDEGSVGQGSVGQGSVGQGGLDWNERIDRLRQIFIEKCESALGIEPNLKLPIRERVYKVQAVLEALGSKVLESSKDGFSKDGSSKDGSEDTTVQPNAALEGINPEAIFWDAVRLLNFDAIYDGYVAEAPTPERFLDTLIRLEREVFHIEHAQPKAARNACFYVGEPINLKDYLADYQRDRSGTVERLAAQLHRTMQSNLNQKC